MKNFSYIQVKNQFMNNLPVIISILILILSISYTINQLNIENHNLKRTTSSALEDFSLELKEQMKANINIVATLMLHQWINTNNQSHLFDKNRFLQIVPEFFNYSPSFLAINWINTSGVINWVYPYARNADAINKSIIYYPDTNNTINDAFALAQQNHIIGFSHYIKFLQGGDGFVAYIPIIYHNITTGYFDLVFEIQSIANYVSTHLPTDFYSFKIINDGGTVYNIGTNFTISSSYVQHSTVIIYNQILDVYTRPVPQSIKDVSLFGQFYIFITEILLCIAIYYLTNQLKKKNTLLKSEFEQKEQIMQANFQNKKLEALGSLSGGIAHDFNNILTNITGHLQIIESEVIPELTETKKETLQTLENSLSALSRNVKRSKEITGQILAFSKQGPIEFQIINLFDIIYESIKLVKETNDRRVIFEIDVPKKEYFVYGNQSRLIQIFLNILINSINAMTGKDPKIQILSSEVDDFKIGGVVNVKVPYIEKGCSIKIRDNGKGMSEEQVINAFDPFYSHKHSSKGTGLGLGIVYNNVNAMNGKVSIKSELNNYTEVEIQLPLVKAPDVSPDLHELHEEAKLKFDTLQSKTMLIIDDEKDIIDSYSKIFEKYGLKVIGYTLGTDAWEYYKVNFSDIDIVLTDINLPDINGFDLIALIKTIKWNQKVILMTGFTDVNSDDTEFPIVQKPFDFSKILHLLSSIMESD